MRDCPKIRRTPCSDVLVKPNHLFGWGITNPNFVQLFLEIFLAVHQNSEHVRCNGISGTFHVMPRQCIM